MYRINVVERKCKVAGNGNNQEKYQEIVFMMRT